MNKPPKVAVIGAGFYGLVLADKLARAGANVTIFEASPELGKGASWANQARVHGGYHYPRDVRTGARSRRGLTRFTNDFGSAVVENFTMLYGIARNNSKVTTSQFEAFCRRIEAPYAKPSKEAKVLFNDDWIAGAYQVQEPAFNSEILLDEARQRAQASGAILYLGEAVEKVTEGTESLKVSLMSGTTESVDFVLDCTYSKLGTLFEPAKSLSAAIKIERAEICIVAVPKHLDSIGITVMDGPFFSLMPFPTRDSHSFTHVSYTPRRTGYAGFGWSEEEDTSAFLRMQLDAFRYVPAIAEIEHKDSIFTDKAVLVSSELDDARPVMIHEAGIRKRYISILGSKIDTVYDAVDSILSETQLGRVL